jgi:hypothetical protein
MYAEQSRVLVVLLAEALPADIDDKEGVASAIFAMLIGTLQLARAVDTKASGRILEAGKTAIRVLAGPKRTSASCA